MFDTALVLSGGQTNYPVTAQGRTPQYEVPGFAQVVYITMLPQHYETTLATFGRWFEGREEVEIVDHGSTDKLGHSYIVIEWFECEIDQLFIDILDAEDVILDYTEYSREVD